MEFFSSWYFIGIMALLLFSIAIIGPLLVIFLVIRQSSQKSDREARRQRDID